MAAGSEPAALRCAKALRAFVGCGKALLDLAEKESRKGTLQEFIRQKIRIEQKDSLLGLIDAAAALYSSLSVARKKDAEDQWSKYSHCAALQETLGELQELEVQWDDFLQRLDQELQLSAEIVERDLRSKHVSPDLSLTDARTGETVTLDKYLQRNEKTLLVLIRQFSCLLCRLHIQDLRKNQELLDAHSVGVVVVSFGCQDGAAHWLRDTNCHYEMLLDPSREMYAALGLGASLKKVLGFGNMLLYAEYVADKMQFPRGLPSIQDDMFQLGGDFVLDQYGKVLFSHRCQSPLDRPSVERILSAL
ncbi:unnamed protein product [Ophioblennius macclurei]